MRKKIIQTGRMEVQRLKEGTQSKIERRKERKKERKRATNGKKKDRKNKDLEAERN